MDGLLFETTMESKVGYSKFISNNRQTRHGVNSIWELELPINCLFKKIELINLEFATKTNLIHKLIYHLIS